MRSRLDQYIARQNLVYVVALAVILCSFVVAIDLSLNFDRFVGAASRLLKKGYEADPASFTVF